MLANIVSIGLGFAADKVLSTAAKAALPIAKTTGEKIIQKAGCFAISAGVSFAIDKMISEASESFKTGLQDAMGIDIIEEDETE